jgi:SAM-dependent methyltransferase
MSSGYLFDQAWHQEQARLRALEVLYDPASIRHLADLGVGEGWHCLEVGGGAGSIARWLAEQVGSRGRVLATDVDTRFLHDHGFDNLQVERHDILTDPLPADAFDLAHERVLLMYLDDPERALARMVGAVRPGGWVMVEAIHVGGSMIPALTPYVDPPEHAELLARIARAGAALLSATSADPGLGPRLPKALREAGLENIGGEVHSPLWRGGVDADFFRLSMEQIRQHLPGTGLVTEQDVERVLELAAQPSLLHVPFVMVTAWGQRPAARDDRRT